MMTDSGVSLCEAQDGVFVHVLRTVGSVPRESGAWLWVDRRGTQGTVGGGHLEHQSIAHARALLSDSSLPREQRFPLGPALGQCCGGVVVLGFEPCNADRRLARERALREADSEGHAPVALFGGGHVGHALAGLLGQLPFCVRWIDSREGVFPTQVPTGVESEHSDPVQGAVADLLPGSHVLIMSFSHAEDLDIVMACLRRQRERADLGFIGLIGSRTKWASFQSRLRERGFSDAELSAVTCPIGVAGVKGKEPMSIAVAVAAQLLALR